MPVKSETPAGPSALVLARFKLTRTIIQNLTIVALAALLCLPCLLHGIPQTGTATEHTSYQYQFSREFWNGDVYPRWMMNSYKGYGSPIFLIQYPLPYLITALLRPLTAFPATSAREARELGIFYFLVVAVAGLNARLWLKKRHTPMAATAAALVYICLPYFLAFELYSETAIGQLTVLALMPLALALCDSLQLRFKEVSALGLLCGLLMLGNLLTTLLCVPLLAGYAIVRRESNRLSLVKCVASVLLSIAAGACLAAVYMLPFVAYLRLFDMNRLLSLPGYEIAHHLSFVGLTGLDKPLIALALCGALSLTVLAACFIWRAGGSVTLRLYALVTLGLGILTITPGLGLWLFRVSGLKAPVFKVVDYYPERLLAMSLMTLALAVFSYSHVLKDRGRPRDHTASFFLVIATGAFLLTLPWSAFLWKTLPVLARGIQYPHRLGVLLTIATAGLLAAAMDSCLQRLSTREGRRAAMLVASMAIAVILGGILTWRADWTWRKTLLNPPLVHADVSNLDVDRMYHTFVSPDRMAAFVQVMGPEHDKDRVPPALAQAGTQYVVPGQGIVNVKRESPRKLRVSYTVSRDGSVPIGLLYFPLWKIEHSSEFPGSSVLSSSTEGLVEIPLLAGHHELVLVFDGGWPERYGTIVTYISITAVALGMLAAIAVHGTRSLRGTFLPNRS